MSVKLQIVGTGCAKCARLADATEAAAQRLGLDYELEKVTDRDEFLRMGVMLTPALAIDGKVVATGKVPTPAQLEGLLAKP